jgi:RNA polymerase sigma factor (sigma-70 family)
VKDCIQDIFANLYRNKKNLVTPDNVKAYLFVSMKNSLLRYLYNDNMYERKEAETETAPFLLEPTVEEEYMDNEELLGRKEIIEKLLSVLSPRQKEIIYYHFIQELQWTEICKLMNLNYQSAQNLIQRALKKIRESFNI